MKDGAWRSAVLVFGGLLCLLAGGGALARDVGAPGSRAPDPVARGEYLVRIANCGGCHTAPGGAPFAGGLRLESELGTFRTPNITPDPDTGIGGWTRDDLWMALHRGERPDGASLYPACPYPSLTRVSRGDVDAIYAYLQTVPPAARENGAHDLDFPFNYRALLPLWRALYFEPATYVPRPGKSDAWNRGAYLVRGPGHCFECHRERNFLGALADDPADDGGMVHGWYAPSLNRSDQAGMQGMSVERAATLLRTGKGRHAVMMGPMADVVFESLQHLTEADARAMAVFLTDLPDQAPEMQTEQGGAGDGKLALGRRLYDDHCSDCHGKSGGGSEGIVALAGNRGVTMDNAANVVNVIRLGGFPASVPGHARPYGMPPHYDLSDREIAAVATYIRQSWGNRAGAVSPVDVGGR